MEYLETDWDAACWGHVAAKEGCRHLPKARAHLSNRSFHAYFFQITFFNFFNGDIGAVGGESLGFLLNLFWNVKSSHLSRYGL